MSSPPTFSAPERRAALLFLEFLDGVAGDSGSENELLVAREAIETVFGIDADRDSQLLNPNRTKLLDLVQADLPNEEVASATKEVPAKKPLQQVLEEQVSQYSIIKDNSKFKKYLSVVSKKGLFKGTEEGSPEYVARFTKVVQKFVSTFPGETAKAKESSLSSEEATQAADQFKAEGNAQLKAKDFRGAVECYTKAIETDPKGPKVHMYLGNRAAARQHLQDFQGAAEDCRSAIQSEPSYVKSYTRLAAVCISLQQYEEAIGACEKALELDETNASAATYLARAQRMQASAPTQAPSDVNAASASANAGAGAGMPNLASMMGALGGGSGSGGMPDIASMMQNPMMQNMMNTVMSNPEMMQNMMGAVGNMMGGNGTPDIASMMQNPQMMQMAQQLRQTMGADAPTATPDADISEQDSGEAEEVN